MRSCSFRPAGSRTHRLLFRMQRSPLNTRNSSDKSHAFAPSSSTQVNHAIMQLGHYFTWSSCMPAHGGLQEQAPLSLSLSSTQISGCDERALALFNLLVQHHKYPSTLICFALPIVMVHTTYHAIFTNTSFLEDVVSAAFNGVVVWEIINCLPLEAKHIFWPEFKDFMQRRKRPALISVL
jgi:hypothetical protein